MLFLFIAIHFNNCLKFVIVCLFIIFKNLTGRC